MVQAFCFSVYVQKNKTKKQQQQPPQQQHNNNTTTTTTTQQQHNNNTEQNKTKQTQKITFWCRELYINKETL
jgi:hypothetical protein